MCCLERSRTDHQRVEFFDGFPIHCERSLGMSFQSIENYGVIGNMRSIALVGMDGSIDFLCYPSFDSPTVFAALLDDERGPDVFRFNQSSITVGCASFICQTPTFY